MSDLGSQENKLLFELELDLTEKERAGIGKRMKSMSDTPSLVAPRPQIARKPDLQFAILAEPIIPSLIVTAITIRDVIAIARILIELARGRKQGRQEINVKMGSDSIRIRADTPMEVAVDFLQKKAKIIRKADAVLEIGQITRRELDEDVEVTKNSVETYEKFVREFPMGRNLNLRQLDRLKWAEKMLEEYKQRLKQLERQRLAYAQG